jgi:nicotinamide-nucleotide amidase
VNEAAVRSLDVLADRHATLATAESLTCGLIAATLSQVPGASRVLRGGLAAYATDVKVRVLGVDPKLVERHGVISAECAEAMAARATSVFSSDWAVASTGVAGPDPQEGHEPGTVFIAVAGPGIMRTETLDLLGAREELRVTTVERALLLLVQMVVG